MDKLSGISSDIKHQLAFTCTQEKDHIPPRDPEADQLYKRARWLAKGNILKQDARAYPEMERLLRIATAFGHDKANLELRDMLEKAHASSPYPVSETIELVQDLVARGIPSGYYGMAWYLEHGYGVRVDRDLAFKYYRKSADLGSPEGQLLIGDKLTDERAYGTDIANIGWSMYRCAADQRYPKAANEFGIYLRQTKHLTEAMQYFQIAASEGNEFGAGRLSEAFSSKGSKDEIYDLGQVVDPERQVRYYKIADFLSDYEYLNPVVPDIDQIVPLPPAKLPPWNGKFKWLEEHEANVAPPMPTEQRIAEMARAKGLDPKTGRSLQAVGK